jgi:hypothetical protein
MSVEFLIALISSFLAPIPSGVGWQKDNIVMVAFVSDPGTACSQLLGGPPNPFVLACVDDIGGRKVVLPNPCLIKNEHYARLACHELGHTNGWRHEYR